MPKNTFEAPELSVEELSRALYKTSMELQEANNQILENERNRLEFYANISHDLRAPITALSNTVEYMLSNKDMEPEELQDNLQMMQKRITYMKHLINDIFLLSSLESSDSKVHKEPVDIRFFLEDFFYSMESEPGYSDCKLSLNIDESLDATLNLDPILMQRVLNNLFANAKKYSEQTPCIELGAYASACADADASEDSSADAKSPAIIIYVEDHGIGISKEHIDQIFERSYMVGESRTPGEEAGSGFGLSIVKTIIAHHGGTISCESQINKGSRFIIRLPL